MATTVTRRPAPSRRDEPSAEQWGIAVDPHLTPRPTPIYKNWDLGLVFRLLTIGAIGGGLIGVLLMAVALSA